MIKPSVALRPSKSRLFFPGMKMGKDPALSAWGDAGARDSGSFKDWGMHLIKDLIFPGKKVGRKTFLQRSKTFLLKLKNVLHLVNW